MASPVDLASRERSRARITIILLMLLLTALVVEETSTPFIITVYSKGCWSVNTGGLFQHFNVRGCGTQSWLMVDLYAHANSEPVANGASDVTIILTNGAGPGGGCVGGSMCSLLTFAYGPPSPITCQGCVVTQTGLPNPLADWTHSGLSSFPIFTALLLVYLAKSLLAGPRIYSGYLENKREKLDWKDFTDRRKTLTTFALGFLVFRTYQYTATMFYLFVQPVPTLGFPLGEILSLAVAVWLMRYLRWRFPFKIAPSTSLTLAADTDTNDMTSPSRPASTPQPVPTRRLSLPVILGVALIVGLVTSIVAVPPLYSSMSAFLAPKPNIQINASPTAFTALPGSVASTSIIIKSIRGSTTHVSLTFDQSPPCNGACYTYLLEASLSETSLSLSLGQTGVSLFSVNPHSFADPGEYDFIVRATPDQGPAVTTIVMVRLAGFTLSANPSVLNFTRTSSAQSTITISSVNGYSGLVTFDAYTDACRWPPCPSGPVASLSAKNVSLQSGAAAFVTLTVASMAQGSYQVVMAGQSSQLFQAIMIPTTTSPSSSAADFSLTVIPGTANVRLGQSENFTIEVSSVNGCICIVQLTISHEVGWRLDSSVVYVDPTRNANSTLTLIAGNYQPGIIPVTVTGTSGLIVHSVNVILDVI